MTAGCVPRDGARARASGGARAAESAHIRMRMYAWRRRGGPRGGPAVPAVASHRALMLPLILSFLLTKSPSTYDRLPHLNLLVYCCGCMELEQSLDGNHKV